MKTPRPECVSCSNRKKSLLGFCGMMELNKIDEEKSLTSLRAGQTLFQEGSLPSGLFCISSGKVKLHREGADGHNQIISLARPGDVLGLSSLLSHTPHSTSATALEPSQVCVVPSEIFNELFQNNGPFFKASLDLLVQQLEKTEKQLTDMASKPVRERLACALMLLKNTYGEENENDFSISISRENLAELVGTAKESVIRLLSEFKSEGLVRAEGRTIFILNPVKLEKICGE